MGEPNRVIPVKNSAVDLTAMMWRGISEAALITEEMIESCLRAIRLRNREIEEHSRRTTCLLVKMATMMGFGEEELVYMRWGALLHDIGKIGVPDEILHKPGPLTEDEWQIMRQHPVFAQQILSPITYLGPALVIPYCHHEKWDGSGYPRGLKGEEIPLPARIFSVADVWDALTSERPYRPAWDEARALEYISGQAGQQFDPHVVEVFLCCMEWDGVVKPQPEP